MCCFSIHVDTGRGCNARVRATRLLDRDLACGIGQNWLGTVRSSPSNPRNSLRSSLRTCLPANPASLRVVGKRFPLGMGSLVTLLLYDKALRWHDNALVYICVRFFFSLGVEWLPPVVHLLFLLSVLVAALSLNPLNSSHSRRSRP